VKKSNLLKQVGITADGKLVVSGLFRIAETEGLPLEIILELCLLYNVVPSWIHLYQECLTAGMKHSRIIAKLDSAISDSFGKEFRDEVISTLDLIFKSKENT
jgi:hypothetical protein